ncbi:hypothetical protein P171DRAFT_480737 [Karstenula rhodostoma CBS 690.94]|uniref:Uncharacterized protein n=1 Tax=Karstenula rhodostoma CBS 690.94 TaxID=1392251 RepID=A0A9P4PQX9_9PLEO|nr:hypothetical protein P171DRAFT_480737 [Karstenula rhodostoma CBS 690.94]
MNDTPQDPTIAPLLDVEGTKIKDEFHSSLDEHYFLEKAEEGVGPGYVAKDEDLSAFLSLPEENPVWSPEGVDSIQGTLDTDTLGPLHETCAKWSLDMQAYNEQTNMYYQDSGLYLPSVHQQDTLLPKTEHKPVVLRDAKQLLAEKSAEREKRKRMRATELSTQRKRTHKASNTSLYAPVGSAEHHYAPGSANPALGMPYAAPPAYLASSTLHRNSSNFQIVTPDFLEDDMSLLGDLYIALSVHIDCHIVYTTAAINSLTDRIWTKLSENRSTVVQGERMWEYISDAVRVWPEGALRVLASMHIVPGWYWVREGMRNLLAGTVKEVDDGEMDERWKEHARRVVRWNASAGSR